MHLKVLTLRKTSRSIFEGHVMVASKVHLAKGYHGRTLNDSYPAAVLKAPVHQPDLWLGRCVDSLVQGRRTHESIAADMGTGKTDGLPPESVFANERSGYR